jgi:hypothetical protein
MRTKQSRDDRLEVAMRRRKGLRRQPEPVRDDSYSFGDPFRTMGSSSYSAFNSLRSQRSSRAIARWFGGDSSDDEDDMAPFLGSELTSTDEPLE